MNFKEQRPLRQGEQSGKDYKWEPWNQECFVHVQAVVNISSGRQ